MSDFYEMIFKRKSFHVFKEVIPLQQEELKEIESFFGEITPLIPEIKVEFRLVPKEETSCKKGEYCILIYSEFKCDFLQNVGYMGEQLDLWLASKNIGVCWYGLGKTQDKKYNDLDFAIMLAIGKTNEQYFRKDYRKAKRRATDEISGGADKSVVDDVMNVIKFSPSACNSQPWFLEFEEKSIKLYRTRGKKGIVPFDKMAVINRVDVGIIALFLEIYLQHHGYNYTKEISSDTPQEHEKALSEKEKLLNISYLLSD